MFRSRAVFLGSEANEKAESGQYYCAIKLFSEAIDLNPNDYRFYLNRAFCYERSELYHLALADSEEALRLKPTVQLCYLRKAKALAGLGEYMKAEQVFKQVLQMNPNCIESRNDLIELRGRALIDMGFDKQRAIKASTEYESIRAAIDGLLSKQLSIYYQMNSFTNNSNESQFISNIEVNNELNNSFVSEVDNNLSQQSLNDCENECQITVNNKENTEPTETGGRYADKARDWALVAATQLSTPETTPPVLTTSADKYEKPTNNWNYWGLRVENINIKNKMLIKKKFTPFGRVVAIKPVGKSKSSVWIFYDNPVSPVEAISRMQSTVHSDINNYINGKTEPLRIYFAPTDDQPDLKFSRPKQPADNKGECYYWRTTTCVLGDQCSFKHINANKRIDAQVWMKGMDGKAVN